MTQRSTPPNTLSERTALYRVLDAALNRAVEGLRVVEDYVRFALNDRHLLGIAKELRHAISDSLKIVITNERYAARDIASDVGTTVTTEGEASRADLFAVATASMKRAQQALRSLEEYTKVIDPGVAASLESLRYRLYTLERALETTRISRDRLASARLYVLIGGQENAAAFERHTHALAEAGVDVLQLRDKKLSDRELIGRARVLRSLTAGTNTLCIINDRPDIAAAVHADGVQVGQDELTLKDVRAVVGPEMLIGVSTHSVEQARGAVLDGANYIGVGPVFPSTTKAFEQFVGPGLLREVWAEVTLPAFAIGGITLENLDQVLAAGFTRIAVSGAISNADDPAAAAAQFRKRLQHAAD